MQIGYCGNCQRKNYCNPLLLHRQAIGQGAPRTIIRCHDGHFKALSRCQLVGRSVRPGENVLSFSRLQLSQRHPPMRSQKRFDQNCSQISEEVQVFSLFETIFNHSFFGLPW